MKTYSIPILVSKNLSRRIEKKEWNQICLKNIVLWTSKINSSNIPHIHVVNHYYTHLISILITQLIAKKDDFNKIISTTQGSMHIFSFTKVNSEGYSWFASQSIITYITSILYLNLNVPWIVNKLFH